MHRETPTFSLFKRTGGKVYFARFKDKTGKRIKEVSTGQGAKVRATAWAAANLEKLLTAEVAKQQAPLFKEYAATFYDYDKSSWIRGKLARGGSYTRTAAYLAQCVTVKHLIPYFGDYRLNEITVTIIETWLLDLPTKAEITPATANRIYTYVRSILKEASRTGLIHNDPTLRVRQLAVQYAQRGILTPSEVVKLFNPVVWNGDSFQMAASMLAAATGMRLGEIMALQRKYVHPEQIEVRHSWTDLDGLKAPKSGKSRIVAIPALVYQVLVAVMNASPYQEPDSLVFHGAIDGRHPLDKKVFLKRLREAMAAIGISKTAQNDRVLCFHSFRHFAATYLRSRAPDHEVRLMTGHSDTRMLDRYTDHVTVESLGAVRKAQGSIFGGSA